MFLRRRTWRVPLTIAVTCGAFLILGGSVSAAVNGEFLYVLNAGAGVGGIVDVSTSGTNFYAIIPGGGSGFSTTSPPYPNPSVAELSQARANGRIAFGST